MARRQKGGGFLEVTYAILVLVLVVGIILAVLGALGYLTPHSAPAPAPAPAPEPAPPTPGPAPTPSLPPFIPTNGNTQNIGTITASYTTATPTCQNPSSSNPCYGITVNWTYTNLMDPTTLPSGLSIVGVAMVGTGGGTNTQNMQTVFVSDLARALLSGQIQLGGVNTIDYNPAITVPIASQKVQVTVIDSTGNEYYKARSPLVTPPTTFQPAH